ncbi:MAG: hypothetical protein SH868_16395 [Bythopirellula sp.]|nr:hypothetical protein [Bythopirellula sp.]
MIVLELLTTLLLAVHLLAMNLASAGPVVCIWLRWGGNELNDSLGRQLAWWSIVALVLGMVTGGLLIVTTPGDGLWNALARFPANAYWFAAAELVFSLVCLVAISGGWQVLNKWWLAFLAVMTATNLLYHFPPMMAVIGQLATNGKWASEAVIDRPVLLGLMGRGEVLALSFHFGLSSLAVAGIAVLQLLTRQQKQAAEAIASPARGAAVIALVATLAQIPIGVWLLTSLPAASRTALMGTSSLASLTFLVALVTSLGLLQRLVTVALGETDHKNLRQVVSLLCGVVLLMTFSLRLSRPNVPLPKAETKIASNQAVRG